ncbi:MAG: DNA polymerase III subunit gamma/tau [Chloroflexi bacterium]|nr:DNA polymerase III subunit gamma/tau [Chloroflexota bacterium]MQC83087.1 DNA polymerase III subunit gamma/tau [Chloroflexota bacterium]
MVQQAPQDPQRQQVLYRKWRPRHFADVVGQEPVTTTLQHVVDTGSPAHAYLFSGPRGTGKTSTGRILAKALNCRPGPNGLPDPECEASYDEGRALDLIELDAASNRGIDEIRDLRENAGYSPALGPYKVYLIDEAHMLTDAAFNALLKTLEEPPPHVIFILATTEPHRIPATISSRCQRFDFRRHTIENIIARLELVGGRENVTAEDGAYELIARQATGSLRDAENLLDQLIAYHGSQLTVENVRAGLGLVVDARTEAVANAAIHRDLGAGLNALVAARDDGVSMRPFMREVVGVLRSALLLKAGAGDQLGLADGEAEALTQMTSDVRATEIVAALTAFGDLDFSGDAYDSLPAEIAFAGLCTGIGASAPSGYQPPAAPQRGPAQQRPNQAQQPNRQQPQQRRGAPQQGGPRGAPPQNGPRGAAPQNGQRTPAGAQGGPPSDAPPAPPTPAAAAPAPFVPPDAGDVSVELETLRANWEEIRAAAKKLNFKAGAFLTAAFLKSIDGDTVQIGFRYPNHVEQMRENDGGALLKAVTQAVSQVANRELQVQPVVWEEMSDTGPAPSPKTAGGHLVDEASELGAVVIEDRN